METRIPLLGDDGCQLALLFKAEVFLLNLKSNSMKMKMTMGDIFKRLTDIIDLQMSKIINILETKN